MLFQVLSCYSDVTSVQSTTPSANVTASTTTAGYTTGNGCQRWEVIRDKSSSQGTTATINLQTIKQCLDYCNNDTSCVAVDIVFYFNPVRCSFHHSAGDLAENNTSDQQDTFQYRLSTRCTNNISDDCYPEWSVRKNQRAFGAFRHNGLRSVQECLDYCGQTAVGCVAVDVNSNQSPPTCWLYFSDANLSAADMYEDPGINHYRLVNRCSNSSVNSDVTSVQSTTPSAAGCPVLSCPHLHCKTRLELDDNGCDVCQCHNPCKDVLCPPGKTCVPVAFTNPPIFISSKSGPKRLFFPTCEGPGDATGMDCADIVIGAARGKRSRIGDYYTSDRSTPRPDEFYGGRDSLTAAVGEQSDDGMKTTILFRKPLATTEDTDNEIVDEMMTVIWAHGQSPAQDSIPGKFYRPDEIKYHSRANRGKMTLNFFDTAGNSPKRSWASPSGCEETNTCDYKASWSLDVDSDVISFKVEAKQVDTLWTGIGFGKDKKMENIDVYVGSMNNGSGNVSDRWGGRRYSKPTVDSAQNIQSSSIVYDSGVLTMSFQRPRDTGDQSDWAFSDTDCYYFMFPVGGGDIVNGDISKHSNTPAISDEKICIKKPPQPTPTSTPTPSGSVSSFIHNSWSVAMATIAVVMATMY